MNNKILNGPSLIFLGLIIMGTSIVFASKTRKKKDSD